MHPLAPAHFHRRFGCHSFWPCRQALQRRCATKRHHTLLPGLSAAARRMAARIHALHGRIHTFYLKFLQGHT